MLGWDIEFQFLNKDNVTSFTEYTKDFYAFLLHTNAKLYWLEWDFPIARGGGVPVTETRLMIDRKHLKY